MKKSNAAKPDRGNRTASSDEKPEQDSSPCEKQKTSEKKEENRQILQGVSMVWNLSFGMAACVFIGFFLGRWLDRLFGTVPVLIILFTLLGFAASFKMLFDAAKKG